VQLAASQEGLSSMELVSYNDTVSSSDYKPVSLYFCGMGKVTFVCEDVQ
jgi:hypothetical protein